MIEREKNTCNQLTVGQAREIALSHPKVARIAHLLPLGKTMKSEEVAKIMKDEGYAGWRAFHMLILSYQILAFSNHVSGLVDKLNLPPEDNRQPLEDEAIFKGARGECYYPMNDQFHTILHLLSKQESLSAQDLESLNNTQDYKKIYENWFYTFAIVRAKWADDTGNGLVLTKEGLEMAIDLGIAPGYEEESERRHQERVRWIEEQERQQELIRLNSCLCQIIKARKVEEIKRDGINPDSLEEIDPIKLRDLVIYNYLYYTYSHLLKLDPYRSLEKPYRHYLLSIQTLEQLADFSSPEEFESLLEELGRQKYQEILQGNIGSRTIDGQIEIIEHVYECLKFPWKIPGPRKLEALEIIQQLLGVPFWSEQWQFQKGLSSVYRPNHTIDSREEEKITAGTIVQIRASKNGMYQDFYDEKEWEVLGFTQGMFSGLYPHMQHVHLKDRENWLTSCYLSNVRLAE